MKEHPILFSTPMVQALLDGRKTMTRRIVKHISHISSEISTFDLQKLFDEFPDYVLSLCPYSQPVDLLWVRETAQILGFDSEGNHVENGLWIYKADGEKAQKHLNLTENARWKPSIHMPKVAARIWLKITNIKVERVRDISEVDAKKEGVDISAHKGLDYAYGRENQYAFRDLWIEIHGSSSWEANPWVWAIEFEILSTTGKPSAL